MTDSTPLDTQAVALWSRWFSERSTQARNALVVNYMPLAAASARYKAYRCGWLSLSFDVDDFAQELAIVLTRLIERYDPSVCDSFTKYASPILANRAKDVERLNERFCRKTRYRRTRDPKRSAVPATFSLDTLVPTQLEHLETTFMHELAARMPSPTDADQREVEVWLAAKLRQRNVPARKRLAVVLRLCRGWTMNQIGQTCRRTPSWVYLVMREVMPMCEAVAEELKVGSRRQAA